MGAGTALADSAFYHCLETIFRFGTNCEYTSFFFFFIRMFNFGAEAENSYIFSRFEAENILKMLSPDDFDGVEVILEQL